MAVHLRLPGDGYRIHPTAYDRLEAVLNGTGPVIKPDKDKVLVVFGLRVDDLPAAQYQAAPLVARIAETLGLDRSAAVAVRMINTSELDAELSRVPVCAGAAEIAAILGVSRQRAYQIAQRADFPKPVQQLMTTTLWREDDVRRFAASRNALPGRPRHVRAVKAGTDKPKNA